MSTRLVTAALAAIAMLLIPIRDARADACTINEAALTCANVAPLSNQVESGGFFDPIGSWFTTDRYPDCGTNTDYAGPQDVYSFTCFSTTDVQFRLNPGQCPLDLFILENSCNPTVPGSCAGASFNDGGLDFVNFRCELGSIYYIVVERPDDDILGDLCAIFLDSWLGLFGIDVCDCNADDDFPYNLTADCYENCDNLYDDDFDGLTDCQDPECPTCREICDNGKDDDLDGLVDCNDDDCKEEPFCCDVDGDGWSSSSPICGGRDCNDNNEYINPDVAEVPADGVDSNCDGFEDCYIDADRDFFGLPSIVPSTSFFCLAQGVANNSDDCDDSDPLVNPNAPEIIANGQDDNCDAKEICYVDGDVDTFGTSTTGETSDVTCTAGGWSLNALDCNDADPNVYPGATDFPVNGKDEDCDGKEICFEDLDGDQYGTSNTTLSTSVECIGSGVSPVNTDCNDTPGAGAAIFPGATEAPADLTDQNCDAVELCFYDQDRDGYGNEDGDTITSSTIDCSTDQASLTADDCDDDNPQTYPGAPDPEGDGVDQNCDQLNDCYVDNDGDGYGASLVQSNVPNCAGAGLSNRGGDCNDSNAAINPGAVERVADGIDQDCDTVELCYRDADDDGFGRSETRDGAPNDLDCNGPNVADNDDDCDDSVPGGAAINPTATEIPNNGIDENCDSREICYTDADNDGFGSGTPKLSFSLNCDAAGVSANDQDCDDNNRLIYPGATETPANGVDQDCDGFETCYFDQDDDNYGSTQTVPSTNLLCGVGVVGDQLAPNSNDCDDEDGTTNPGAPFPNDCRGFIPCFEDNDGDGFGKNPTGALDCSLPGYSDNNLDCNDDPLTGGNIYPGAPETPLDGVDQNCDGFETCYQDLDNDGYGSNVFTQAALPTDCTGAFIADNDDDCNDDPDEDGARIYPGAPELPGNGVDNDCDNRELCFRDQDGDGYGDDGLPGGTNNTQLSGPGDLDCEGNGLADNDEDCDDASFSIKPGGVETVANGVDEDCDGLDMCFVDEDDDGYGIPTRVTGALGLRCNEPQKAPRAGDCYDVPPEGASIFPGAPEIPGNGIDENCDSREVCYRDQDSDGWGDLDPTGTPITVSSTSLDCIGTQISNKTGDCAPTNSAIHPGAEDIPANGIDENCDNLYACWLDQDRDTYGVNTAVTSPSAQCIGDGVSNNANDCNDVPPLGGTVYPGAPETVGDGVDSNCDGKETCYIDNDRDGFGGTTTATTVSTDCLAPGFAPNSDDCNDGETSINPDADDLPADLIDQDCDGDYACYQDNDGDGFGVPLLRDSLRQDCIGPLVSPRADDCNDALPGGDAIYPGAAEVFSNGIDDNCDGLESCFRDEDGDGFGDGNKPPVNTPAFNCVAVDAAPQGGDCDDDDEDIYPGQTEITADGIDQDCDGVESCYRDRDQDGYGSTDTFENTAAGSADLDCRDPGESLNSVDCVDQGTINGVTAENINPGMAEICNEVDDDCDGDIDDEDPSLSANVFWFNDEDNDGFGTLPTGVARCNPPDAGWTTMSGDCDDSNPNVNPGEDERCDPGNVDENCNGKANNADVSPSNPADLLAVDAVLVFPDQDGDGWGVDDPYAGFETCTPGSNSSEEMGDCNDQDELVNPDMDEIVYDGRDNDCDPATPDDDLDGDGVLVSSDCNDVPGIGAGIFPGATETCNGIDDDCNGFVDDTTACFDDDGDGFTENGGDCNDGNASIHPGAPEKPNNTDDDCDGTIDEGTTRYDDDGDGFCESTSGCTGGAAPGDCNDGDPEANPGRAEIPDNGIDDDCDGSVDGGAYDPDGDGYTSLGGDCDESDPFIYPGAPERPNGRDDDCDDLVDEGTRAVDDDGDGYCELSATGTATCTDGALPGDCNDDDEQVNPGAGEIPTNSIDDDCDGQIDEGGTRYDDDDDGFAELEGDCNDGDAAINPNAEETADGVDNDCDGQIDEGTADLDDDGYTVEDGDCDDNNGWISPEQPEVCDGLDNDCDGEIDEAPDGSSTTPLCDPSIYGSTALERGCGNCNSTGGSPLSLGGVLAMMVLLVRRRKGDRRAA